MESQTIEQLLASLHLDKYIPKFQEEEITIESARELGDEDFKSLGIPLGPRKALLHALSGTTHQAPPVADGDTHHGGGGCGSGGFDKSKIHARWPPLNSDAATKDGSLEVNARKNIRDSIAYQHELEQRLKKALGPEWYFSWDWSKIYHHVKQGYDVEFKGMDNWTVCNRLATYFLGTDGDFITRMVSNLEELAQDGVAKTTFLSMCPAHVFAVDTDPNYQPKDYDDRFGRFAYVDGAFLVTFNSGPGGLANDDFTRNYFLLNSLKGVPTSGGGRKPQAKSGEKFPRVDIDAAIKDPSLDLAGRKNLEKNKPHLANYEKQLKSLLGTEWFFSIDYQQIWNDIKEAISAARANQIGDMIHGPNCDSYLGQVMDDLKDFCKDELNTQAFVAKCPTHAYVFRTTSDNPKDKPYGGFAFEEGAFIITIPAKNVWSNLQDIASNYALTQAV